MADRNRGIIHDTQLDERAEAIRVAQTANFNSAERVGSLFADIIQYIDDHEEEWLDKGSGDGSVPSGMGRLISSLWVKTNPATADQILHWDGSKWEYITTPSGGTGGGISLSDVWNSLNADNSSNQIHQSHLAYVTNNFVPRATFNATKWWGNTVNTSNNTVTGNLVGNINSITFGDPNTSDYITLSYEKETNALKVSKGNTGAANFYATGGVSALGYSAGGSSGGEDVTPANLNDILSSINSSEAPLPTLSSSSGILYNPSNSRWEVKDLNLEDLKNVVIDSNLKSGQGLVYNGTKWVNGTVSSQEGATTLAALTDTTITPNSGGQLLYRDGNNNWVNKAFSISDGSISFGSSNYTFITSHQSLSDYLKSSDARNTYAKINRVEAIENKFTGDKAKDADKLDGNDSSYFATADELATTNGNVDILNSRMTTAEGKITTAESEINTLKGKFNDNKSAWGNTYLSNGEFQNIGSASARANINYAGSVNMGYVLAMEYDGNDVHDPAIYMKALKTDYNLVVLTLHNDDVNNKDHHLAIGSGTSAKAQLPIRFFGRHFLFNYTTNNIDSNGNYSTEEAMMIGPRNIGTTANPVEEPAVYVRKHLMVGDGSGNYFPVTYDYANNALCFSGNIYATGGVSALGFSSTANGGAMINGPLEVDGTANLKSDVTVNGDETVEGNSLINGSLTVDSSIEVISVDSGSTFITGPFISADSITVNEVDTTNITVNNTTTLNGNSTFTVKNNSSTPVNITIKYNGVNYTFNMQKAIEAGIFVRS